MKNGNRKLKKIQLHRETLLQLAQAGKAAGGAVAYTVSNHPIIC